VLDFAERNGGRRLPSLRFARIHAVITLTSFNRLIGRLNLLFGLFVANSVTRGGWADSVAVRPNRPVAMPLHGIPFTTGLCHQVLHSILHAAHPDHRPGRVRPTRAGDRTGGLSTQERQVAGLVAAGRTNRQIATQLHVTENTVETHLKRIFAKLNVSSRAALATIISGTRSSG
jgi:DNA-binding CsgD family transcriptional regulator